METQFKIVTETVIKERMYLSTKNTKNLLAEIGDKQVFGTNFPSIAGNTLRYNKELDYWSFGCSAGKISYDDLVKTIQEAEEAIIPKKVNGLKAEGKPNIEDEVQEESEHYYIAGGIAYSKEQYKKSTFLAKNKKQSFGQFKWTTNSWNDSFYSYKGHDAGSSIKPILNSLKIAKAIIDFFTVKSN